ncbi:hypothetical protein N7448_004142 [Penicillium atrosanguineum]|uniref:Uncharacterized protein n=1 Tax=Penicillium atrosanguineum TaxID=1132637 RepID=A0A9W9HAG6_9EURO|nr:uncharacterized protein N7443_003107 [Penicillium atrosanguineum]KAJ5117200.1 hypothetical protein N7526_011309 [Penicillium atrosanguineum]KAJ5140734.1 hypothetical protein N7448_004142 [Penicillium atrosanguineum]KAJ5310646.1 hypothetical protein N7443_003107 [Penicillium atrosanguineum]KAJ5316169.1 hypothetical protein N7476_006476 [Penicillium atrosanguineum]
MSDFLRRASDAFHHRQRQDSTDSTDTPKAPDAANPPQQEPVNQKFESAQPESHVNEAFSGTATENVANPKQPRHWGWGNRQRNATETKQQSSQAQKDDTDWVVGT